MDFDIVQPTKEMYEAVGKLPPERVMDMTVQVGQEIAALANQVGFALSGTRKMSRALLNRQGRDVRVIYKMCRTFTKLRTIYNHRAKEVDTKPKRLYDDM